MQFCNLDLLPQKKEGMLVDRKSKIQLLQLTEKITELSIKALEAFFAKRFSNFDAQVGENLCQIRAYKILLLGYDLLNKRTAHIEADLQNLKKSKGRIKSIINNLENFNNNITSYNELLDKKETVTSFYQKNGVYFSLSLDTLFLILSYFLDFFSIREERMPIAINHKEISIHLFTSKYISKRITHDYQKKLTQLSTDFIIKISKETPSLNKINEIMPELKKISDEDRTVLPCHNVTLAILENMIIRELPLLIIAERKYNADKEIDKIMFLYSGNKNEYNFIFKKNVIDFNMPCMVIRGEMVYNDKNSIESQAQYSKRFMHTGVMNILLQNTAMHPQYSGAKLLTMRENPYLNLMHSKNPSILSTAKQQESILITYKNQAMVVGCCKENPKLFHLKHIFCNTLSAEIDKTPWYIEMKSKALNLKNSTIIHQSYDHVL
ncbi:MAG: hypothetical protein ABSF18_04005 [Gammaproteobacteria bacterium]|jgi:hypothetical protein